MKKLVLVLVAALALVGCGSKAKNDTQVISCVGEEDGMKMTMDINVKEEKFENVDMNVTMEYEAMGLTPEMVKLVDEDGMKELMATSFPAFSNMDLKLGDKEMTITVLMNSEDFVKTGFVSEADINQKVDVNDIVENMSDEDFTCTVK